MVLETIKNLANNVLNKQKNVFLKLCTPAKIEYIIALIALVSLSVSCLTESSGSTFNDACSEILPYIITTGLYLYILQVLCKGGASTFAWFIVLSPVLVLVSNVMTKTSLLKPELYEEQDEIENFDVVDKMLKDVKEEYAENDRDEDEDEDEDFDDDFDGEDFEDPDEDEDFKKIFDGTK